MVCLYNRGELQPFQKALAPLGVTDADLRGMERKCCLRIAFSLVPAHPQHAPVKKLHLSGKMEALAGQLPSELLVQILSFCTWLENLLVMEVTLLLVVAFARPGQGLCSG